LKRYPGFSCQVNQPPEEYKPFITGTARKVAVPFPEGKTVYDFMFNKDRAKWAPWTDLMDDSPPSPEAEFVQIIVPTADTVRYTFLMEALLTHGQPMLLVGPTGTGKSVYIKQFLTKGLDANK
jgi:dynein heavy chain